MSSKGKNEKREDIKHSPTDGTDKCEQPVPPPVYREGLRAVAASCFSRRVCHDFGGLYGMAGQEQKLA